MSCSEHQARLAHSQPKEGDVDDSLVLSSHSGGLGRDAGALEEKVNEGQARQARGSAGAEASPSAGSRRSLLQASGDLSASDLRGLIEDKEQEIKSAAMALKDLTVSQRHPTTHSAPELPLPCSHPDH